MRPQTSFSRPLQPARRTAASTSGCMPPSRWYCLCRTATCVCCFPTRWRCPARRAAPARGWKARCCGDHRLPKGRQTVFTDRKLLQLPGAVLCRGHPHHQPARPRPWRAQHLRHCGAVWWYVQLFAAAGPVCAAHLSVKGRFNAFYGRLVPIAPVGTAFAL